MDLLWSICLILCGCLAASTLIAKKQPNAKELIDKLVPIQGYLGLITLVLGLWALINLLMNVSLVHLVPLRYLVSLAMSICMIALGFLLGFGLINQFALSKNPEAAAKGAAMQLKIATYQIPLGVLGIILGVWVLVMHFV
jgi:hypothetical protein